MPRVAIGCQLADGRTVRTDGEPRPRDFVIEPSLSELRSKDMFLVDNVGLQLLDRSVDLRVSGKGSPTTGRR